MTCSGSEFPVVWSSQLVIFAYLDENRVTRAQLYADGLFLSDENGNVVWGMPEALINVRGSWSTVIR